MSWEPVELDMATDYQVRYLRMKDSEAGWIEEDARESKELLCPKDGCGRLCYLVFNLPHNPSDYIFQVRAKVDGEWNHWRSAPRKVITGETAEIRRSCCIVPPPYMVENIGSPGSCRYYVVVDERDPPGESNWTELTDKVTANKLKIPYYVAASYDINTLTEPKKVRIGDGTVIGGYLNYPLVKGKKYNYEVYTVWNVTGVPVTIPYPKGAPKNGHEWSARSAPRRGQDWYGGRICEHLNHASTRWRGAVDGRSRGDFEDGYMKGYKDANKLGSASAARRRMDDDYGTKDDRFHEGYVKGLKDAGMTGMSTSMHNLAQRGPGGGYSTGFMQGYKDGNSGIFGDRVTPSLISRLDEQYPGQDDFKQGYVDGFKEGAGSRTGERRTFEDSRRLQQSLTELTERLTSLEKTKGDEIHSTKIYHVYNQQPDTIAFTSSAQQLAHELEEINSTSRRSTLRRHYTPGDYLKQASEGEGYGTLGRNRRSLSASALARDSSAMESRTMEQRSRHASGTGSSYITRSAADRQGTDTYSKRYNYRSRSDVGSPRRYASQTLLDGSRPGPSTPHARRDALSTLQRELDTLSRSPDRSTPRGYTSDTGNAYDTVRSKARGYSNYDYDTFSSSRHHETRSSAVGAGGGGGGATGITVPTTRYPAKDPADDAGRWADDLLEIVSEPMNKTLDRMKKYSSSSANVEGGAASTSHGDAKEIVEEKYHRSYKEKGSTVPKDPARA
ncbi:hypothetical protein OSTOST_04026 [Ostertagia ostertagi]